MSHEAEVPFAEIIEMLRQVYGAEHVHTGSAVPASTVSAIEKELGVSFPADYRAFVETWGFVCAGEMGIITVYGVANDHQPPSGLPDEVDVRRATRRMRDASAKARDLVAVVAGADDVPSYSLHVFDKTGALRVFVVRKHVLEPATGLSFAEYLTQQVQEAFDDKAKEVAAEAMTALENAADELDDAELSTMHLMVVPPEVVRALEAEPECVSEIRICSTFAELGMLVAAGESAGLDDEDDIELVRRQRRFLNALGAKPPTILAKAVADIHGNGGDALAHLLAGVNDPAAALFDGSVSLHDEPDGDERSRLVRPDELRRIATSLDGLEARVRAGYDAQALRAANAFAADEMSDEELLEMLAAAAATVAPAARDAARRGWGWVVMRAKL